ncbi:MAG: hypothetical protein U9Q20_04600 [Campylobacterota bacterium]|nr:hypothetical protein [Campylobacterota bacterium]
MNKKSFPYLSILTGVILINIYFSIYFITILLVGVVYSIFMDSLKKRYYYIFLLTILTFVFIETIHGIKIFSLSLLSLFLYYFVIPRLKHIFSSQLIGRFTIVSIFYLGFYIINLISNSYSLEYSYIFIVNLIIDSLIVGFVI